MIGWSNYFGIGFPTVIWKPLYPPETTTSFIGAGWFTSSPLIFFDCVRMNLAKVLEGTRGSSYELGLAACRTKHATSNPRKNCARVNPFPFQYASTPIASRRHVEECLARAQDFSPCAWTTAASFTRGSDKLTTWSFEIVHGVIISHIQANIWRHTVRHTVFHLFRDATCLLSRLGGTSRMICRGGGALAEALRSSIDRQIACCVDTTAVKTNTLIGWITEGTHYY